MTSTSVPQTATLPARTGARLWPWIVLWAMVTLAEALLLWNGAALDTRCWLDTRAFLRRHPAPVHVWEFFKLFGHAAVTAVAIGLAMIFSKRRWLIGASGVAATAIAGGLGGLIAITLGRFRPLTEGANQWVLFRGFHVGAKNIAYPSGHATLAFATAAVLVYFFPRLRWIAVPIAAGCAFSRVAMGAHFYADILLGAALGWTIAWWICVVIDARFAKLLK
jgi:hypothetical protein